jgi:quercetin dioxygenase-like cupin family protein
MTLHAPHHHAWEEMCLVKEGEVEVSINGQKHRAGPGFLVFFASHDAHSIENVSDKPATYYVLNICTPLIHTTPDKPAVEQAAPGKLPSSVFDCNSVPATPNATGSTAIIFDSATLTFPNLSSHITMLNTGQSTRTDLVDSGDELFFVKSGLLEVTINGISCRLKAGSLFYCAPNDKRTLKNTGPTSAAYQVIRVSLRPARER